MPAFAFIIPPFMDKKPHSRSLYLRLLLYTRPYWKMFLLSLFSMVVLAATEPAMPALMKPLLDGSFVDKDPTMIKVIPLLLVLLFFVRGLSDYVSSVSLKWVSGKVVMDLRTQMFSKLQSFPSEYFDHNPSGNIISRFVYNVDQVTQAASSTLIVMVRDSLSLIGLMSWMIYLNWKLSLIFLIVVPAIAITIKLVSYRLRRLSRILQQGMGDMTHILEEAIRGNRVVKLFGGQQYEENRFRDMANRVRRFNLKITAVSAANVPIVQMIAVIALAIIIYISSLQSLSGHFTVGSFVSFFGAMALLFSPIKRLAKVNEQLQRGLAAAESIFHLLGEQSERDTGEIVLEAVEGRIEFRDTCFHYASSKVPALEDINLVIEPGETIALVGKSGSGKTSLAALVPRFYQPGSGQVLLDGIDLQQLSLASLRGKIALVNQDIVLFNDSVAANIAYGAMREASRDDIIAAAEAAHAMEFIRELPEGLDTFIGENGARLSGGQRQRLAIARALLKNAPILILDEATSALDSESEHYVHAALETLKQGRTAIIIAHRLSTIEHADRIVVLEKGRILECGSHRELLDRGGAYSRLHHMQMTAT